MEEKLLELILEYANSERKIDLEFICRVGDIYLSKYDMDPRAYLAKIEYEDRFNDLPKNILAGYQFYKKYDPQNNLKVSHDQLRSDLNMLFGKSKNRMSKREFTLLPYIFLVKTLLHEFEHTAQKYKMCENAGNPDEVKLLKSAYSQGIKSLMFYSNPKIYAYFPTERLAELKAAKTINEVLKPIAYETPLFMDHTIGLSSGYGVGTYDGSKVEECPTYKYCQLTDNLDVWKSLEFYDDNNEQLLKNLYNYYSPEERFIYGFQLNDNEISLKRSLLRNSRFYNGY